MTVRERVGVYILLTIFGIVFPVKFGYKLDELWKQIEELKGK